MNSPKPDWLPVPLKDDVFTLYRRGVSDDSTTKVWVNTARDFAFLDPQPKVDYRAYRPRVSSLSLSSYKATMLRELYRRRTEKLCPWLSSAQAILEFGGGDAAYLDYLREAQLPAAAFSIVEPDRNSLPARQAKEWLTNFEGVSQVLATGERFDVVMMFHVFEHIAMPDTFLAEVARCLKPDGWIIVEVPCLHDPLLSLYECEHYQGFYFQLQHPFVYSGASLNRVLRACGFVISAIMPFQRYGLENHLAWLSRGRPGGDMELARIMSQVDNAYIAALEADGRTDTVLAIARPERSASS